MVKMNNLVSVLVPAYNHENYIQDAIKSIINQTYENIELIVIDDGSKDNTWQKIKELEEECKKRFVNVYFETKENEGTCKTLNKLISKANGDFITFLGSDDLMAPNLVQKLIDFLSKNNDYILVVCDDQLIDINSNIVGWNNKKNIIKYEDAQFKTFADFLKYNRKDVNFETDQFGEYSSFLKGNYIPNGYLIRKDILLKYVYPFTTEAPLEDYYMMLQLSKAGKFRFIDEPLYLYRIHNSNTSKNKDKMLLMTNKTLSYEEKIVNKIENKKWEDIFNNNMYNIKYKINLGCILKVYRKLNIVNKNKNYVLEVFNKPILTINKYHK